MDFILATAGYDYSIRLWEPPNVKCFKKVSHPDSQVNKIDISPDGKHIISAGYQQLRLYDINSPSPYAAKTYEKFEKNVTSVGYQRFGKWVYTGGEDSLVCIWDLRTATCQRKLKVSAPVNSVALHPDQSALIIGQERLTCSVWDLRTDREVIFHESSRKDSNIQSIAIARSAKYIAALDNKGVLRVWQNGRGGSGGIFDKQPPLLTEQCHPNRGIKTVFSPDGEQIVTTSADKTAVLWGFSEVPNNRDEGGEGAAVSLVKEHVLHHPEQKWVWDACFTTDSKFLFTGSSDGTVRLWSTRSTEETPSSPSRSPPSPGATSKTHSPLFKKEYAAHQKAVVSICFWDAESFKN